MLFETEPVYSLAAIVQRRTAQGNQHMTVLISQIIYSLVRIERKTVKLNNNY